MSTQYIEIYSEHRNRQQYPLTSNFVIPFQSTSSQTVVDPIVNGAVYYTWNPTNYIYSGTLRNGSTNSNPLLSNINGEQPTAVNAYLGLYFHLDNGIEIQTRLITGYQPATCGLTLQEACSNVSPGQTYTITDTDTESVIQIPYQDKYGNSINDYEQAYTNYYIVDETLSNGNVIISRPILSYDFTTRSANLQTPFPAGWSPTDQYTLRQTLPFEKWTLTTQSFYNTNSSNGPISGVITLPLSASPVDQFYRGKYIYFYSNSPPPTPNQFIFQPIYGAFYIKYYNGSTRQAFVDKDLNNTPLPYYLFQTGSFLPGSTVSGPILSNGSSQDRSYINYSLVNVRTGESRVIIGYTGLTRTASLDSPFTDLIVGDSYDMFTPVGVNITAFTKDNFTGLDYIGTMVSINTSVCYEISLVDLILPNVPLVTGSRAAYYPFLYVKLTNETASEKASTEIIYSNNPPSKTALFIVPVLDIVKPTESRFVKLNASEMKQTIKFKPNDSFHFSVTLPDGRYFQPVQADLTSPYAPDNQLQIHATFSIRRI